jgi:iron complex outermembrane receptor protein
MRGDEGNDASRIGGYSVLNLRGDYRINENLRIFLNIDNVLDQEYETFGLFGEPDEVLGDGFDDSRFLSPAAPRAAWLGVQLDF